MLEAKAAAADLWKRDAGSVQSADPCGNANGKRTLHSTSNTRYWSAGGGLDRNISPQRERKPGARWWIEADFAVCRRWTLFLDCATTEAK